MQKIALGSNDTIRKKALKLIILLGVVSLFGDIIYEGARSVNGPYLAMLGANAAIVGLIVGIGEFLGYGIRLISGYFSDKTKAYWFFTIIGYGLLFTVPLLSLAGVWQIAALFIVSERIGKALRVPSRDTILSQATKQIGTGFGFGIHEFFDQIGAIIGALIFALLFFLMGTSGKTISDYQMGYSFLWVPFVLLMVFVFIAYFLVKKPEELEPVSSDEKDSDNLSKTFWLYTVFSFITTIGFVNFALIGYHLKTYNLLSDAQIPLFYVIAMAVNAVIALIIGKTYDKLKNIKRNNKAGLLTLMIIPIFSLFIPFFAFSMNYVFILISVIVWGVVMGSHETIMRSAIADITPLKKRGTGYGIFTTSYGLALFIGSVLVGVLYECSLNLLIISIMFIEIIAIPFFFMMWKTCNQIAE
ncbi:MAG: MFS transporter [Candidatus Thermoplasmatota archaeon]|nr:MFS transporter [Candidatus Thermoplasmatota archaeon]